MSASLSLFNYSFSLFFSEFFVLGHNILKLLHGNHSIPAVKSGKRHLQNSMILKKKFYNF